MSPVPPTVWPFESYDALLQGLAVALYAVESEDLALAASTLRGTLEAVRAVSTQVFTDNAAQAAGPPAGDAPPAGDGPPGAPSGPDTDPLAALLRRRASAMPTGAPGTEVPR